MPSYNAISIIQDRLAGILKAADWPTLIAAAPYWTNIAADSQKAAYYEIQARLLPRGYSLADVTSWDRGAEFERDIALYWCLIKGAGLHDFEDKAVAKLD